MNSPPFFPFPPLVLHSPSIPSLRFKILPMWWVSCRQTMASLSSNTLTTSWYLTSVRLFVFHVKMFNNLLFISFLFSVLFFLLSLSFSVFFSCFLFFSIFFSILCSFVLCLLSRLLFLFVYSISHSYIFSSTNFAFSCL